MSERSRFGRELSELQRNRDLGGRRWIYVPYDQLNDGFGPLAALDPREAGVLLIEHPGKAARRPYHRQKLALVLSNQRHFALEQAARGVVIDYRVAGEGGYAEVVRRVARERGPLIVQEPAERELREELRSLLGRELSEVPHAGWLTTFEQFQRAAPAGPPYRMDAFYRVVRRELNVLMERGKPRGGRFSFDAENRKPYRGEPAAPETLRFSPDAVTLEVGELIERHYSQHPGQLDLTSLPATRRDAEQQLDWALANCLPTFGPFEDAMSTTSSGLFHTRLSPLINLHRLLPSVVLAGVLSTSLPLASQEGFVRQVLGWREFVRHVHRATDGFRVLPAGIIGEPAAPSALGAARPLPPAYWGDRSGLACLDHVVTDVWREAYSHHITRLMVLSNLASLLELSPRELTDWFWVAYADAYDWVVEPNVLAMGTYAVADLMTTKPYVSGAAYIQRM
ncbi:MAG TPA: cryptochrome/photolyase family protein, partial [Polyangiaceae bacterium]|nr:cryptochrome/photolyase family protein [Polyangiaceae bacterium]